MIYVPRHFAVLVDVVLVSSMLKIQINQGFKLRSKNYWGNKAGPEQFVNFLIELTKRTKRSLCPIVGEYGIELN